MSKTTTPTAYRQQLRELILQTSLSEFMKNGINAVKMDDIAKILGISKRTLYEIYSNKEELILEVIKMQEHLYLDHMADFVKDSKHNVIDIVMEFYNIQIKWWANTNIEYFTDLHKYRKVKDYIERKDEEHKDSRVEFMYRGVEEGLFRPDVDYPLLSQMASAAMEHAKKIRLYEKYSMEHLLRNMVFVYIRGVCTSRGIAQLDAMLEKKC